MPIYRTDKKIIKFSPKAAEFLNGLTANELEKPRNVFLNIHGRIIAVCDQIRVSEDELWVVVEPVVLPELTEHLKKYLMLGGVKSEELGLKVYFDLDGRSPSDSQDKIILQKQGHLLLTDRDLESDVTDEQFLIFRVRSNIPVQGIDFKNEMLLNVSAREHVSFIKGCYLGQEPISKVHNRSRPTWRLVAKRVSDCTEEEKNKMTSRCTDPESGEIMGFVFEKVEG